MQTADVSSAADLDRTDSQRALLSGIDPGRRFESILYDGYDPDRVEVKKTLSLLEHVGTKRKFALARRAYYHRFWCHLRFRDPEWPERDDWISSQFLRHELALLSTRDCSLGIELGVLDEHFNPNKAFFGFQPEKFATLDGLLLLLTLYRQAQDLLQHEIAASLGEAMREAALTMSADLGYTEELIDTWRYLLYSRMLSWNPRAGPSDDGLRSAREKLLGEVRAQPRPRRGKRGAIDPESLSQGRSERRWRRRVWIRAASDATSSTFSSNFFSDMPVYKWIAENRELIQAHVGRAIELLVTDEEPVGCQLRPLSMPLDIFHARKRPVPTEENIRIYGSRLPYDVIPVEAA